jgi:receptor protein-tyrosine kinase
MADIPPDPGLQGEAAAADLGELLVQSGLISREQAEAVDRARDMHGRPYGEIAIELGLVSARDLQELISARIARSDALDHSHFHEDVVAAHFPRSRQAEDFRALRNTLSLRWFKHPEGARTLAVISANRGEGRSVTAANLAVCFAQIGLRTLLVDADMRSPRQHKLFGIDDRRGLSSYLNGRLKDSAYPNVGDPEKLSLIPGGEMSADPHELLLGAPLGELIAAAEKSCDVILFDTPAASESSDYQMIASACRGALVVTREKETRVRSTARLINECEDLGIKLVGATMVAAK